MELVISKVIGLQKSSQWKDIWYHEFNVIANIDGKDQECRLSVGSKAETPPEVKSGTVNVEPKPDYNGKKQFKLVKPPYNGPKTGYTPRSGGGGGRPMENPAEKRAGVSMSYAVALVNGGKAGIDKLYTLADDIYSWMEKKAQ